MVRLDKWSRRLFQQVQIEVNRLSCVMRGAASLQPFPVILVSMEKCLIYHSKSLLAKFFFFLPKIDFSVALSLPRKPRLHLFILPYFNSGNCFDSTTKSMANSLDVLNIISVALLFLHDQALEYFAYRVFFLELDHVLETTDG